MAYSNDLVLDELLRGGGKYEVVGWEIQAIIEWCQVPRKRKEDRKGPYLGAGWGGIRAGEVDYSESKQFN